MSINTVNASFEEAKKVVQDYYPLYINGEWVDSSDGGSFDVYCPANGEKLATVAAATKEDLDRAIQAAEDALPSWKEVTITQRYEILNQIYRRIIEKAEELAVFERLNSGKTVNGSNWEIKYAAEQFPYFASAMRVAEDGISSAAPGSRTMVVREPVGVVGSITPWNVPFIMACWKIAPALAAGNTVVIKPSSYTPLSTLELVKAIADLLPPGVVNIVNGGGSTVGNWLIEHPKVSKLSFTGSTDVGIKIGIAAAQKLIPVTLELGGKSAGIYFDDIPDIKTAAFAATMSILNLAGQGCALQSRILVQETIYDEFVEQVASVFRNFKVGLPWDPQAQMGAIAYESHMKSILDYIEIGKQEGARLVCGGNQITEGEFGKGYYIQPTLFADVDNSMRIAQEEIFGPVACVIKFKDEAEAIKIANDSQYGLSGGIWTGDLARGLRVAHSVRTGQVTINGAAYHSAGTAFGGYKNSGIGRESYKTTLDHFSEIKSISYRF
jgi:acyl-CoA reductase-like NAD-dependent aldehyde dehydrogenase